MDTVAGIQRIDDPGRVRITRCGGGIKYFHIRPGDFCAEANFTTFTNSQRRLTNRLQLNRRTAVCRHNFRISGNVHSFP